MKASSDPVDGTRDGYITTDGLELHGSDGFKTIVFASQSSTWQELRLQTEMRIPILWKNCETLYI
ncbi:MAG: hypothetical protein ACLTK0_10155 [Anaerovoracaceae bacterium]